MVESSLPARTASFAIAIVALVAACAGASPTDDAPPATIDHGPGSSGSTSGGSSGVAPPPATTPPSAERAVLDRLGLVPRFAIGMGNDLPKRGAGFDITKSPIYSLPTKLDLHYAYLSGLQDQGGWPDDDGGGGAYIDLQASTAAARAVVPMFSLYQAAAWGEDNFDAVVDPNFMDPYWAGAKLLFQKLAAFDKPAIVHFEPDFWGEAQQHAQNDDPRTVPVLVGSRLPECAAYDDDVAGMGRCLVHLARTIAPKVVIGFQASTFGAPDPARVAAFLVAVGAGDADITIVETLDRDAGCFEEHTDPRCQRDDGPYYWDDTNASHPNFHDHLTWARAIRDGVGKPLLWWQMPFGVAADAPGGSAGHYRDNRVKYLFDHTSEFVAAGGIGAVFGAGAPNQTTVTTDGGQFASAIAKYFAAPAALP
jgi:hypothetical protein